MRNFAEMNRFYQPRKDMIRGMQQQGMSSAPVQHWAQGLSRLAQALVGRHLDKKLQGEMDSEMKTRKGKMSEMIESLMQEKIGEDQTDTLQVGQQWGNYGDPKGRNVTMESSDVPSEAFTNYKSRDDMMLDGGGYAAFEMPDSDEQIPRDIMGLGKMGKMAMAMNEMSPGGMDMSPLMQYQMLQEGRKYAADLLDKQYKRDRSDKATDSNIAFGRAKELKKIVPGRTPVPGVDAPYPEAVLNQKMGLANAKQNQMNPLEQEQYNRLKTPTGQPQGGGTTKEGIPIAESTPWAGQSQKDAAPMRSKVYSDSSKLIQKYDAGLKEQKILSNRLKRFKYLNSIQPTNESFMGIPIDRITDFSFDEEKREMVSIVDAVTPLMRQGLPGAASERDTAMFRGATVGIGQDQATNDNIVTGITTSVKIAEDYQKFRKEYLAANKHLEGADVKWQEYLEDNPIFDPKEPEGSYALNANRRGYKDYFRNPDRPDPVAKREDNIPPPPGNYVLDPENK